MAAIKEFRGLRPKQDMVTRIAELPYDVVSSEEARDIAKGNQYSFFHVSKPEIDLPDNIKDTEDSILKEVISCNVCKRGFRIVPPELQFLRGSARGREACANRKDGRRCGRGPGPRPGAAP